jgi:hypothetical protein
MGGIAGAFKCFVLSRINYAEQSALFPWLFEGLPLDIFPDLFDLLNILLCVG